METIGITITNDKGVYKATPEKTLVGNTYDHLKTELNIIRAKGDEAAELDLLLQNAVISSRVSLGNNSRYSIPNNFTTETELTVGLVFSVGGAIKNTAYVKLFFARSLPPDDFKPGEIPDSFLAKLAHMDGRVATLEAEDGSSFAHANLAGLGYEESGHIGFASSAQLATETARAELAEANLNAAVNTAEANLNAAISAEALTRASEIDRVTKDYRAADLGLSERIDAQEGLGGYLQFHDFGSVHVLQSALNAYAISQISGIVSPSQIFNGTRVVNTYDNATWVFVNTPQTSPPVLEWIRAINPTNIGLFTDSTAGVIKGHQTLDGAVSATSDGYGVVNGWSNVIKRGADGKTDLTHIAAQQIVASGYVSTPLLTLGGNELRIVDFALRINGVGVYSPFNPPPVLTDGETITGNGTPGSPLVAVGGVGGGAGGIIRMDFAATVYHYADLGDFFLVYAEGLPEIDKDKIIRIEAEYTDSDADVTFHAPVVYINQTADVLEGYAPAPVSQLPLGDFDANAVLKLYYQPQSTIADIIDEINGIRRVT